jgi:hypothetical protein
LQAGISVAGQPDWLFVKLHCHGMDPRDEPAMMGTAVRRFLSDLMAEAKQGQLRLHFVTAREMVNIALAGCDGSSGDPGEQRNYRYFINKDA